LNRAAINSNTSSVKGVEPRFPAAALYAGIFFFPPLTIIVYDHIVI
jgi:hypothetical protein